MRRASSQPSRALAAALLLAGCSLMPDLRAPGRAGAAVLPERPGAAAGHAGRGADRLAALLHRPAPARADRHGAGNNRDLRVAVLNIEQARAQYRIRAPTSCPTVDAERQRHAPAPGADRQRRARASTTVGLGVTAWELDFFGRIAQPEGRGAGAVPGHRGRRARRRRSAWCRGRQRLADAAGRRGTAGAHAPDAGHARGVAAPDAAALRQRRRRPSSTCAWPSRWSKARAPRWRSSSASALQDENALALLLGAPVPAEPSQGGTDALDAVAPMPDLPAGLPSDLLSERPDIRAGRAAADRGQRQHRRGARGLLPAHHADRRRRHRQQRAVGPVRERLLRPGPFAPQLLLPIFDAGRNQAGLDSASAARDIAVAQYEKSIQTAFREVADALAGRATLGEQLRAHARAGARPRTCASGCRDLRYRNGVASYLDLLDAQRSLFTRAAGCRCRRGCRSCRTR